MTTESIDRDTVVLDVALEDRDTVFDFEADFAKDLRCIPMVVRFKLDRVGIKLSLKQWAKIGLPNRRALMTLRCDLGHEVTAYHCAVTDMVQKHSAGLIVYLSIDPAPAWNDFARVPEEIVTQAAKAGVNPPTKVQWSKLDTLQRFALLKLARSDHDNHNFEPALCEFGVLSSKSRPTAER